MIGMSAMSLDPKTNPPILGLLRSRSKAVIPMQDAVYPGMRWVLQERWGTNCISAPVLERSPMVRRVRGPAQSPQALQ